MKTSLLTALLLSIPFAIFYSCNEHESIDNTTAPDTPKIEAIPNILNKGEKKRESGPAKFMILSMVQ